MTEKRCDTCAHSQGVQRGFLGVPQTCSKARGEHVYKGGLA